MDDVHQVLYQPCSLGGQMCGKPTPGIEPMTFCTTHTPLVELKRRYPPEPPVIEEQVRIALQLFTIFDILRLTVSFSLCFHPSFTQINDFGSFYRLKRKTTLMLSTILI